MLVVNEVHHPQSEYLYLFISSFTDLVLVKMPSYFKRLGEANQRCCILTQAINRFNSPAADVFALGSDDPCLGSFGDAQALQGHLETGVFNNHADLCMGVISQRTCIQHID